MQHSSISSGFDRFSSFVTMLTYKEISCFQFPTRNQWIIDFHFHFQTIRYPWYLWIRMHYNFQTSTIRRNFLSAFKLMLNCEDRVSSQPDCSWPEYGTKEITKNLAHWTKFWVVWRLFGPRKFFSGDWNAKVFTNGPPVVLP